MDDMDFTALLNALDNGHIDNFDPNFDHLDNLKFCVLLAKKLQSGEVSDDVYNAGFNQGEDDEDTGGYRYANPDMTFEAMTRALIEETRNELQRSDKEVGV